MKVAFHVIVSPSGLLEMSLFYMKNLIHNFLLLLDFIKCFMEKFALRSNFSSCLLCNIMATHISYLVSHPYLYKEVVDLHFKKAYVKAGHISFSTICIQSNIALDCFILVLSSKI